MSSPRASSSWQQALRLHLPLLLGVTVCLFAGWFELSRARAGHTIAWVYVFEWPAFAVAGVVIWWRVVTGHDAPRPGARGTEASRHRIPDDDPGLRAWRDYVAGLGDRDARDSDEAG